MYTAELVDYMEATVSMGIVTGWCPRCLCPKGDMHNLLAKHPKRNVQTAKNMVMSFFISKLFYEYNTKIKNMMYI